MTQLLDFLFSPATFEHDFTAWETLKVKYERQTGTELPDDVLVATLLNKTSGALQQHLRLNARTLQTYQQTRDTIVEYFCSKVILTSAKSRKRKRKERKRKGPLELIRNFEGQEQRKRKSTRKRKRKGRWFFERLGFGQRR